MCQRQHLGSVSFEQFKTLQLSIVQIGLSVSAGKSGLNGWLTGKFHIFHNDTVSCPPW